LMGEGSGASDVTQRKRRRKKVKFIIRKVEKFLSDSGKK
jgi:hypothetical protein